MSGERTSKIVRVLPHTTWRLTDLRGRPLDVTLNVDTTSPLVVTAIERAADAHGITLERVVDDDNELAP